MFYEIYPQSFADSDGDGVGDLAGALAHLDHLVWLGVDAVWFNPCFASPFRDAGYDVSDFLSVAPRYGTNDDLVAFVEAARERGIRVLLDLVAGHTSIAHPWFTASAARSDDDRYIWADRPGPDLVPSPGPRPGYYLKNFFDEQPALNYGYARLDPEQPWRQLVDAPGPQATVAALREIIGFWCDRGVSGFRVDMAYSLVKDDPGFARTAQLWRELYEWLDVAYPGVVLLPESDRNAPRDLGVRSGFDADFFVVNQQEHSALFNNGGAGTLWWLPDHRGCFFDADGVDAAGTLGTFLTLWNDHQSAAGGDRLIILPSSDHDYSRLVSGTRAAEQLGAAFTFLLTWGTVPSLYYGDEIGMRYLDGLPDHEGSMCFPGYNRAGCRTPMQWDNAAPNAGFSTSPPEQLYLPQDPSHPRPDVATQRDDPDSPLNRVRRLIQLRRAHSALRAGTAAQIVTIGYPFAYLRRDSHLVVVNPARGPASARSTMLRDRTAGPLEVSGVRVDNGRIDADGFGYGVFALD